MRCLLTGARGLLGQEVDGLWRSRGHEVVAAGRDDLDITSSASVAEALDGDVDVVVNCAAWTAVDDAEDHEAEAFTANAVGASVLARAASDRGVRMVHLSTDYVFDGQAQQPYVAASPLAPASTYGRTKAAGEWAVRAENADHLIVRTAWLYGAGGPCFPKTMHRLAAERGSIAVVDDQRGQPTWARDVADLMERLVSARAPSGTYHATSSGEASWFEFTQAVLASAGFAPDLVTPTSSDAFPRPAPRPAYSVLSHDSLETVGVEPIGHWRERWEAAAGDVLGRPVSSEHGA